MTVIQVRVQVHLPHDANGVSATPGQVITVDTENPGVMGYLTVGYLVPLEPLAFPKDLQPPMATGNLDPNQGGQAQDGEPGSASGRDGAPLRDAGEPIAPEVLQEQVDAENAASRDASASDAQTDGESAESSEGGASKASGADSASGRKAKGK